jgi:hypothetical protein
VRPAAASLITSPFDRARFLIRTQQNQSSPPGALSRRFEIVLDPDRAGLQERVTPVTPSEHDLRAKRFAFVEGEIRYVSDRPWPEGMLAPIII